MHRYFRSLCVIALVLGLLRVPSAGAHALPERAEPAVGGVVESGQRQVRIWFDAELESAFSSLRVVDARGQQVNRETGHVVNDADQKKRLLQTSVPALPPGVYHVFWRVVARDGHATEGDYTFTVRR